MAIIRLADDARITAEPNNKDPAMPETIGILTNDQLGFAIARTMSARGIPVTTQIDRPSEIQEMAQCGVANVDSLEQLAARCTIIFVRHSDIAGLHACLFARRGLTAACRRGTLIVDLSHGSPDQAQALDESLSRAGLGYCDAPPIGGIDEAKCGRLLVPVGGTKEHLTRMSWAMSAVASQIVHGGAVGKGMALRLTHAAALSAMAQSAAETFAFSRSLGCDPRDLIRLLAEGKQLPPLLDGVSLSLINGERRSGPTATQISSDLRLVRSLAARKHLELPAIQAASDGFSRIAARGRDQAGLHALIGYFTASTETASHRRQTSAGLSGGAMQTDGGKTSCDDTPGWLAATRPDATQPLPAIAVPSPTTNRYLATANAQPAALKLAS